MFSASRRPLYVSAFLFALGLLLARFALGADATPAPWLQGANADKYLFVGKTVWDIEAGKIASPTGAPAYISAARPVVGIADRVFEPGLNHGIPSMPGIGNIVTLKGEDRKMPTLDDKPPQSFGTYPGYWAAPDHRRVVWIQSGDYWRGEVDWANVKIINRKQVTSLGVFNPLTPPVLWWGNTLYVAGGFDKEKPIVRINLLSGATDEMETYRAFQINPNGRLLLSYVSPNNCRVIYPTPSVIYCYDARAGKATLIRDKFEDIPATRVQLRPFFLENVGPIWTDDDTVYSTDYFGYLARLDLRNSRMDLLHVPEMHVPGTTSATPRIVGLLPGGRYMEMSIVYGGGGHGGPQAASSERFLLDVTSGQRIPLPFEDRIYGKWLDDNTFLYIVSQGGLSAVGTWVYDRASNSSKRMTGMTIDMVRMLYIKKQRQVWAVSQQSGNNLIRMKLDGSGSENLGACELMIPFKLPSEDPIDLGFTNATVDLWKAPTVDEAALAATLPPEPPLGKIKLILETKDLPAEQRTFADQAYDYAGGNTMLGNYCDPYKVAMKALDAHKADPQSPLGNIFALNKIDLNACADHDRIAQWAHDHVFEMIWSDAQLTAEQKKAVADRTGPCVADAYFKEAKPNLRDIDLLFQRCLNESRAAITSGTNTGTPATTPPGEQPPSRGRFQQGQQNPANNAPTRANDAANPPASNSAPPATAKFCTHCGKPLPPGAKFCPSCGEPVKG